MNDKRPLASVDSYGWETIKEPDSFGYIAPKIEVMLDSLNARRILDLGSGNGILANRLYESGHYVAGVEYDKSGVEISRLNFPKISFYNLGVQDDPQAILAKEKKFDAVVSTEVIEHLYSPHLLPIFARKILVGNGYLLVSTPYHGYLKNLLLSIFDKWDSHHTSLWHGGHIKFWSRKTLISLMESNGFEFVEFAGVGRLPFLWKSMVLVFRVAS